MIDMSDDIVFFLGVGGADHAHRFVVGDIDCFILVLDKMSIQGDLIARKHPIA